MVHITELPSHILLWKLIENVIQLNGFDNAFMFAMALGKEYWKIFKKEYKTQISFERGFQQGDLLLVKSYHNQTLPFYNNINFAVVTKVCPKGMYFSLIKTEKRIIDSYSKKIEICPVKPYVVVSNTRSQPLLRINWKLFKRSSVFRSNDKSTIYVTVEYIPDCKCNRVICEYF
jgi:hypothetical protein